jgi:hypothetical protein
MRRQFQLPAEDVAALNGTGLEWETVKEGQVTWLVLPHYPVPAGYNHSVVSAALRIPASYPDEQIDMVFFHPAIALTSGRGINNLSDVQFDGKTYQQWSRHRTGANPWRPDVDNIGTHLVLVEDWLKREIR